MRILSIAALFGPLVVTIPSRAKDAVDGCASSAEDAQRLRDEGHFSAAREKFLSCARGACPAPVRNDCIEWANDLTRRQPSVIFSVHDEKGADLTKVRVFVDGVLLPNALDGRPLMLDPGGHHVRFEADGRAPEEIDVLAQERQANRVISVTLVPLAGRTPGAARPANDVRERPAPSAFASPLTLAVAGVGIAGSAAWAFFGIRGVSAHDELADGCAKTESCATSDVSAARRDLVFADIAAGVSLSAGATLLILLLTRHDRAPTEPRTSLRTGLSPAFRF